jgi:hypothetical protein
MFGMNKHPARLQELPRATSRYGHVADERWKWLYAVTSNPDALAVVAFCLIGLLLAINLILRFPEMGAVIEQCNQF